MWRALRILLILKPGGVFANHSQGTQCNSRSVFRRSRGEITKIYSSNGLEFWPTTGPWIRRRIVPSRSPNRFTITVATAFCFWKKRLYLVEISAGQSLARGQLRRFCERAACPWFGRVLLGKVRRFVPGVELYLFLDRCVEHRPISDEAPSPQRNPPSDFF